MLQVNYLRQHTQLAKDKLAIKHFSNPGLVDEVIAVDDQRKRLQANFDDLQSKVNAASKEIGNHMAKGEKDQAEALKQNVGAWKLALEPLKVEMAEVEQQLQNLIVQLPNLPHDLVPKGKTPEENEVVKEAGTTPVLPTGAMAHWDLIKKYNLVDFETGAKITGSGFPLYIGKGAKFQRVLTQYFLDFNTAAGYTEYIPPYMVNAASAFATGQLPDKEGQMYHATEDDFYLIPTAEVPVTNVFRDTILKDSDLPIKMTAYSPCFRREAGSFGKEVRGLNRVHQFEKVEIIQIVHPDKSDDTLNEMVAHVENLLISLAKTSAQSGIYMNDLMNTYALTTPINEQNKIVQFLESKTKEIDEIISKAKQEIELLKEYKTALISEVVTGKVDVRDVVLN